MSARLSPTVPEVIASEHWTEHGPEQILIQVFTPIEASTTGTTLHSAAARSHFMTSIYKDIERYRRG